MQHHGHAAPARRQDCRGSDVPAGAEDHADALAADQLAHTPAGPEQAQEVEQFLKAAPLQAAGVHGVERDIGGHQFGFEPVGHPQPLELPIGRQGPGHRQGREHMSAGAAGRDQQAGHGRGGKARLT